MATRKTPLVTGEIYHIFNRSIARQPIFTTQLHYQRMIELIQFYIFQKPPIRFSYYNRLQMKQKNNFFENLVKNHKHQVEIYAYCIMPNHLHFLLKQTEENGISKFLSNIQNSYAKYHNTKHDRSGSLFQELFKGVHIETDEQLLHVMRYIILNPYTGHMVKELSDLERYQWTSFPEYMGKRKSFVNTEMISGLFRSTEKLKQFIFNQADYQKMLDKIKHLILE